MLNVDPSSNFKDVKLGMIDFSAFRSVKVFDISTGLKLCKMFDISFIINTQNVNFFVIICVMYHLLQHMYGANFTL